VGSGVGGRWGGCAGGWGLCWLRGNGSECGVGDGLSGVWGCGWWAGGECGLKGGAGGAETDA